MNLTVEGFVTHGFNHFPVAAAMECSVMSVVLAETRQRLGRYMPTRPIENKVVVACVVTCHVA